MKIAIIGAGAMGGSLARGLLQGSIFKPQDICVANPHEDKLQPLAELGASVTTSNIEASRGADVVALVVKPWLVERVARDIRPVVDAERQIVLNLAAGISASQLTEWLSDVKGHCPALFQIMPNLAISLRQSMTFIQPLRATDGQTATVKRIFDDLGRSIIADERQMQAGTSLSGCGIAYAMRYCRAATEGGVELGFKADVAKDIVLQTMQGAVALLASSGNHPEAEIDKVTTPGGLTIRGLNAMEAAGFSAAVIAGLKAGQSC